MSDYDRMANTKHAFPFVYRDTGEPTYIQGGMTLREYYAGLAMQGMSAGFAQHILATEAS